MQSAVRGTGSPVHNLQLIEPLLCLFGIICVLFLQCLVAKAQEHWRQGGLYVLWLLSDVRWLATGMCFFSEHHSSFCSSWGKKSLSHTSLRRWLPFTHSGNTRTMHSQWILSLLPWNQKKKSWLFSRKRFQCHWLNQREHWLGQRDCLLMSPLRLGVSTSDSLSYSLIP